MIYLLILLSSLGLAIVLVKIFQIISYKLDILDYPNKARKIHKKATPLLGGTAIFLSFWLMIFILHLLGFFQYLDFSSSHLMGIFLASLVLLIGGVLDDKYDLSAIYQIIFPILAIIIVFAFGISIDFITNPFNSELFDLNIWKLTFHLGEKVIIFSILGDTLMFAWLLGMMYTTKLLDGLDGLVSGIALIGGLIMLFLTLSMNWFQADVALLLLVFIAVVGGFLLYNLPKASIFLGEEGALFLGFFLGVISILAGSKIATALLVFALPIIDGLWVMFYRFIKGKSIFRADKNHLHHRLLDLGWSVSQILLLVYCLTFLFGLSTLFLQPFIKLIILTILTISVIIFEYVITQKLKKKNYEI